MRRCSFIAVLLMFFLPIVAEACGCAPSCIFAKNPKKCVARAKQESAAVFSGTVLKIEGTSNEDVFRATVAASRAWKGVFSRNIYVYFYRMGPGCSFSPTIGAERTYFAWSDQGKLFVGQCSSINAIHEYLGKELKLPKDDPQK